jgi:hypothetical protein
MKAELMKLALTKKWHINYYGPSQAEPGRIDIGPLGFTDGILQIPASVKDGESIARHIVKVHNESIARKPKGRQR